jgi:hypothetical protein
MRAGGVRWWPPPPEADLQGDRDNSRRRPCLFGPLAQKGREKLVKRVTAAVLAAEGSEASMAEAHRVWVHLRGIPDGHWAGFGEVVTLSDIAAYALQTDEPESKTARMRRAAMQSLRARSTA